MKNVLVLVIMTAITIMSVETFQNVTADRDALSASLSEAVIGLKKAKSEKARSHKTIAHLRANIVDIDEVHEFNERTLKASLKDKDTTAEQLEGRYLEIASDLEKVRGELSDSSKEIDSLRLAYTKRVVETVDLKREINKVKSERSRLVCAPSPKNVGRQALAFVQDKWSSF